MDGMFNKLKSVFQRDKRSADELLMDAKVKLITSRNEYLSAIDRELRNLRYNMANNIQNQENDHSRQVIKKALFGISLIDQAERELTESHSFKQLFNAMNITTDALNLINRAEKKRPIPDEDSFIKAAGKYKFSRDTDRERLEELFDQLEDYDSMVSDEAVNRLVMNSSEFSRIEREKVYDFTSDFGSIFQDEAFLESCERYDPNI